MSMLNLNDVEVSYGNIQVIWGITLEVKSKEVVALLGSNGSGKTTTLRTIVGLLRPKSGSIKFLDKRIDKLPSHAIVEMGIAYVPEGRHLFSNMTVLENLEMGAYCRRARDKKKENMEFVFQLFPILKDRSRQLAGTLSGGEQQMLALGRGLMCSPKLLMLDEPSLGLAPKLVTQLFNVIERIKDEGVTILLVEQNVRALNLAHRAYIVENGRIVLEGKGRELMENERVKKAYLGM